ncbi:flagellar filament capping protein FliD [Paraburkholderia sp. SARCC-3016]|uniref:flagellar filament capping protein FliD n=1 Tax=Paraburkholderia sp. SARCC-3016 TaxID=3058611 RepID=UPI00280A1E62|nr:flagellar filament capping protein FliD [Paraburkholderia sp. SARCC-3016]MDQ7980980.1 flagellar filament capping protein FliD [Paraburkholderia sp. SARCC-3016]
MSSPVTATAAAAAAAAAASVKQAAQSLIAGATGSPLDVSSLVSALVKAKTAGPAAAITAQAGNDNTEITGLATLSAAMSGLQSAIAPFLNGNALSSFTATMSGEGITAKAGDGASEASYLLNVTQVAQAQSITSGSFSNADAAAMGTGTLTISLGGDSGSKSFQVSVDSSNDSLQEIADAINSASGNPGVKATVITGANGQSISLQSAAAGASRTIGVNVDTTSGSPLSKLAVTSSTSTDPNAPAGSSTISSAGAFWSQTTAAQDAQLTVNGQLVTASTNTVSGAIPGVTLTLDPNNVTTLGKQTLTIASDDSSVEDDLSAFVSAYNAVIDQLNTLAAPGAAGVQGSGGTLLGDEMINQIGASLGSIVGSTVSSGGLQGTLASLGITFQSDTGGQPFAELQIDADANFPTLDDAVTNNQALIGALFNDTGGIAQQLNAVLDAYTSSTGIIATRTTSLTDDITALSKQQDDLNDFAAQLTSMFNDQFTALNTLMAQAQQNQSFLTQLFGGANSSGTLAQNSK